MIGHRTELASTGPDHDSVAPPSGRPTWTLQYAPPDNRHEPGSVRPLRHSLTSTLDIHATVIL